MSSPNSVEPIVTLQYLRGVAAMAVAIYHVLLGFHHFGGSPAQNTSQFGAAGVDLFFVISGFIMLYISAAKHPRPGSFLEARALRVLPIYWLVTIAMFLMPLVSKSIGWSSTLDPLQLVKSLLCIGSTTPSGTGETLLYYPVYRAGWTINYEIFFYFIFAISLVARKIEHSAIFACSTLTALVIIGYGNLMPGAVSRFYTAPILLEFIFGIAIALWYVRGHVLLPWLGVLIIAGGAIALYFVADSQNLNFVRGLPSAAIVIGALSLEPLARKRPSKLLKLLGDASYSIYLTHLFTVPAMDAVAHRVVPRIEGPVIIIYIIAGTLIAAIGGIICFYLVERPLHNWARKMVRGGPSAARAALG